MYIKLSYIFNFNYCKRTKVKINCKITTTVYNMKVLITNNFTKFKRDLYI